METSDLGKIKKQKQKKQKKAKSGGGGLLKNLFGKKKEKKAKKKTKKQDKAMAKKQKKATKKQAKTDKKANKATVKAEKKTAKKESKTLKKATKAENKAVKQLAKQNKERKGANIIDKVTAAQDAAQMLAPELYENAQNKIKDKLNLNENEEEMSDTVTQSENSSGEFATASKKEEEGFFAKHKALIIGVGLVAVAGIVTAIIFSKKKPTQAVAGLLGDIDDNFTDEHLGYIEPIDLS